MGVDLFVPYPKKLVLRTVLETARNLFAGMLGLEDAPDFSVRKVEKGKYIKFEMDALLQSDGMYLVSLKGMEMAAVCAVKPNGGEAGFTDIGSPGTQTVRSGSNPVMNGALRQSAWSGTSKAGCSIIGSGDRMTRFW